MAILAKNEAHFGFSWENQNGFLMISTSFKKY